METADTSVVVLTPIAGDAVQIMKAGILEIADVFVVNKADYPDAKKVSRELRDLIRHSGAAKDERWQPQIVLTTATTGEGVESLVEALDAHAEHLRSTSELVRRRRRQLEAEVEAIVIARAQRRAHQAFTQGTMELEMNTDPDSVNPYDLADQILSNQTAS